MQWNAMDSWANGMKPLRFFFLIVGIKWFTFSNQSKILELDFFDFFCEPTT